MRAKLLEIARHLIAQHGEDALTLSAVANDADIAHATIYGYFSSKREMLNSLSSLPASPGGREPAQAAEPGPATGDQVPEPRGVVPAASMEEAGSGSLAVPVVGDDLEDTVPWNDDALDQPGEQDGHQPAVAATDHAAAISAAESYPEAAAPPQREPVVYAPVVEPQLSPNAEVGVASAALGETLTPATDGVEALAIADAPLEGESPEFGGSEGLHEPLAEDDFPDFEDVADGVAGLPDPGVPEGTTPEDQAGVFATILPGYEQRRAQADQLDTIARHLVLPEGAGKDGTDALIGRLETRLRVLESAIGSLETKHSVLEARSGRQVRPVPDQIEQILKRSEDFEARHLKTLSELRLEIHELGARLNNADTPPKGAVSEELPWSRVAQTPAAVEPAPAETEPAPDSESDEPHADSAADEPRHAYLSAVRTLAKEGARQAAERESIEEAEQHVRRRKVYVAAGVAMACLAAVGLIFKFHPGSHGVSSAQSRVAPHAAASVAHTPVRAAAMAAASHAPLDQLTALANKGDARAELVIGLKYLSGDGVPADNAQAARWLERAAQRGNAVGQNHLGALYQNGRGITRDIAQAKHWYEAAAAQGDRHAMSNLAMLYAGASGENRNFATAARWFQRSASLGFVDAQFNLAVLFERGDGVPQSLLDAYRWYSIAAASGDAVAKTRADAIATQISPEELQAAQRAVILFKPQPLNHAANDVPTLQDVLASR